MRKLVTNSTAASQQKKPDFVRPLSPQSNQPVTSSKIQLFRSLDSSEKQIAYAATVNAEPSESTEPRSG
jgi:hypothetical protein